MTEMDLTLLDQRIHDAEENLIAAATPAARPKHRTSWRICAGPRRILGNSAQEVKPLNLR
jgi:hypothetical protein